MQNKIDFENGRLFLVNSQECNQNDSFDTFDIFKKMDEYYNQMCTVWHWKPHSIESGRCIETRMRVKDAIWQMREGWLEIAIYEIDT
jgi:hypothetical protein